MIHVAQQLDLTERPLRINPVIKRIPYLLNRNFFLRIRISSATAIKPRNNQPNRL